MKITIKVHRDRVLDEQYLPIYELLKENKTRWQAIGAGLSLCGGLLSPSAGVILNILYSFTRLGFQYPALYKISMIFYSLTIPLLIVGGHFLDLLEKKASEARCSEADAVKQSIENLGIQVKTEDC